MKVEVMSNDGKASSVVDLPRQFSEPVRRDLIKKVVIALQMSGRQPYGASPLAGIRASAFLSKRRRKYRGTYGIGQSRTPRKVMSRSGTRFNYTGAFAPQTVGGRRAHPPKASKIWEQKVNEKENRKAIRSALSATVQAELIKERGHKIPNKFPFAISDDFQKIKKTAELKKSLITLGFKDELERASERKIRAGKGKTRGRKYKKKKGILFVVSEPCELQKACKNIPGSDFVVIDNVNVELLAPGAEPGRVTLYTQSAIKKLAEKNLFTNDFKGEVIKKEEKTPKKKKAVKKKTTKKKVGDKK